VVLMMMIRALSRRVCADITPTQQVLMRE